MVGWSVRALHKSMISKGLPLELQIYIFTSLRTGREDRDSQSSDRLLAF